MKLSSRILIAGLLAAASFGAWAERININEADAATLAGLNGVGQSKAEAIVEHRKMNGPFRSVDDLAKVKGVGPAILEKNRDQLSVGDVVESRQRAFVD